MLKGFQRSGISRLLFWVPSHRGERLKFSFQLLTFVYFHILTPHREWICLLSYCICIMFCPYVYWTALVCLLIIWRFCLSPASFLFGLCGCDKFSPLLVVFFFQFSFLCGIGEKYLVVILSSLVDANGFERKDFDSDINDESEAILMWDSAMCRVFGIW